MKKIMALLLALTMVFALCACGNSTPAPAAASTDAGAPAASSDAAAPAAEQAAPKRTDLKVQIGSEPSTLDIQQDNSSARTFVTENLYANLLSYDADGNVVGELAESWTHNDDLTEWTITLKDGLKFSDGSDLTAEDVVFTMQRGMDLAFGADYATIVSCEAISDKEVKFVLNAPNALFERQLAADTWCIMSKAYIEGGADLSKEAAVTSGPYYLAAWNIESDILLKANPYYVGGEPAIKEVDLVIITDSNTAIVAFESGQVDYIFGKGTLTASEVETVSTFDNVQFIPSADPTYVIMSLNFQHEAFSDVRVRKAIDIALNRDYIIAVLGGMGTPTGAVPVFPGLGGYIEGFGGAPEYDLEQAKALLAEAGYPDGFEFELMAPSSYLKEMESIQAQLKEIGLTVVIDEVADSSTSIGRFKSGEYEAGMIAVSIVNGDITGLNILYDPQGALQLNHNDHNEYGAGILGSTSVIGADRDAMLKASYELMAEEIPYIGLYYRQGMKACSADLDFGLNNVVISFRLGTMSWK